MAFPYAIIAGVLNTRKTDSFGWTRNNGVCGENSIYKFLEILINSTRKLPGGDGQMTQKMSLRILVSSCLSNASFNVVYSKNMTQFAWTERLFEGHSLFVRFKEPKRRGYNISDLKLMLINNFCNTLRDLIIF